jgi:phage baseplate assembly protein gpV
MTYEFIENLVASHRANPLALDLNGRTLYPYLGIVTNNDDPLGFRRVRVTKRGHPQVSTNWLLAVEHTYQDLPLPRIGDTVVVLSIEGNDEEGVYMPVVNRRRAPDSGQSSPQDDSTVFIPGDEKHVVQGDAVDSSRNREVIVQGTYTNRADVQYILRAPVIRLISPYGRIEITSDGITFFPGNAGRIRFNCQGKPMEFTNATSVTINGTQVAGIGAPDTGGDVLTGRGWVPV